MLVILPRESPLAHAELYRLKKVQGKKKRDAEASEKLKRAIAEGSEEVPDIPIEHAGGGGDLLSSKDEDVIF